ncbi:zinc ribbon domain-containing protein [Halodesulfurarchaeum sp. HSR-GB]|uniref:Zn-ribbon domain-containing OB-fold protein n=1 Tax=Halodesulfurarchaeum sp. HSR-GB TaxID=3074077 RepID=UPI002862279B|nr:zinc ribbon domain-containing protein [Halodesulfurarchaeum sp. HSR-GB]MDR5657589.1 zinc ribbon domain-containing protein [Halodesulfurarchaeum sp. HSR-GB]
MIERAPKTFYEELEAGRIVGTKCNDCGEYTFPPMTACRHCRSRDLEFTEMSGEGTLHYYSSTMMPSKRFADEDRMAYGMVELAEGPYFFTKIEGVEFASTDQIREGNEELPIDVRGKPEEVAGKTVLVFERA